MFAVNSLTNKGLYMCVYISDITNFD